MLLGKLKKENLQYLNNIIFASLGCTTVYADRRRKVDLACARSIASFYSKESEGFPACTSWMKERRQENIYCAPAGVSLLSDGTRSAEGS